MIKIKFSGKFHHENGVTFIQGSGESGGSQNGDLPVGTTVGSGGTSGTAVGDPGQINDVVALALPAPFDTPVMHDIGVFVIGLITGIMVVLILKNSN